VGQGKFLLNDKNVKTPSIIVSVGDVIKVANEKGVSLQEDREMPVWIKWSKKAKEGKIARLPEREDIEADIDEQLIVEFYSR